MIRIITLSIIVFSALMSEEIPMGSAMPGSDFIVKILMARNQRSILIKKKRDFL